MNLTFDEPSHTYTLDGQRVPSVTQILGTVFPREWEQVERWGDGEYVKERGRQVHKACAYIAKGIEFDCDERIQGRVNGCRLWFADMRPDVIEVETPICHPLLRYAGTPDLVAIVQGKTVLVDYKACLSPVALQLAAYWGCLTAAGSKIDEAYPLQLLDDGKYKVGKTVNLKNAWRYWLNVLGTYRYMEENGMVKEVEK